MSTHSPDDPSPRRRLSRDERQRQLLEVAWRLVREEGTEALTLGRLAEQAGVTKPVVYDHFGTRARLLAALYQDYDLRQTALMEAAHQAIDRHGVKFEVGDVTKYTAPGAYDLVVCIDVMEHILEDEAALRVVLLDPVRDDPDDDREPGGRCPRCHRCHGRRRPRHRPPRRPTAPARAIARVARPSSAQVLDASC